MMKILTAIALTLISFVFISCNSEATSESKIKSEFEMLIENSQFSEAYNYSIAHPEEVLSNVALLEAGKWHNERTFYDKSGELFRRLIKQDPNDAIAKLLLANSYRETRKDNEALNMYNSIADIDSIKILVLPERARLFIQIDETQRALIDIEAAKEIESQYFAIFLAEGLLYNKEGKNGLALDYFETAQSLDPGVSSEASLYAGVILLKLGVNLDAMEKFSQAIDIGKNINMGYAYINRGICQLNLTDTAFACDDFEDAIQYMPEQAKVYKSRFCE